VVAEDRNAWALARLELGSAKRVLEIGFGPGRALRALLERHPALEVCGVDRSEVAVRRAERWRAELPSAAKLHLSQGTLEELSPARGRFDRILAINVNAYWLRPDAAFPPTLSCLTLGASSLRRSILPRRREARRSRRLSRRACRTLPEFRSRSNATQAAG
jgi:trans-aconitate methyltransferase